MDDENIFIPKSDKEHISYLLFMIRRRIFRAKIKKNYIIKIIFELICDIEISGFIKRGGWERG